MFSYNDLKRSALKKYFQNMNPCQQEAVFSVNGAVLVLAGAGSGKTTVIVNRIANMVKFGDAYYDESRSGCSDDDMNFLDDYINGRNDDNERLEKIIAVSPVKPWNILAITFTNKAAGELRSRLESMLGEDASYIHASTFHSACVRILRCEIERLGYDSNFTIYDTDDSQRVIKSCLSELGIPDKVFPPRMIMNEISYAKDRIISPREYEHQSEGDYKKSTIAKVYKQYQNKLESANAIDFDDIISLTVELFQDFPDVLEKYQKRYRYIMVDEYQDTNMAQFELVNLLSSGSRNICVVGDDDQSIYKFRGATIENILSFEEQFDDSKVIRLEQNYRSTQNILSAANSVISNNKERKEKNLWTSQGDGNKVGLYTAYSEQDEASFIANHILESVRNGGKFSDNAVLYRINAQSNVIERVLAANGVPYNVYGGLKFYDRKEIKDIVAYLSVINNENDILRLKRIINEPKRGIGDTTVAYIEEIARKEKKSPVEVMRNVADYSELSKKLKVLSSIARFFDAMAEQSHKLPLDVLLDLVMEKSGYGEYLRNMGEEGNMRLENIGELKSSMSDYTERNAGNATLEGFLEEISLYTDMDKFNQNDDKVVLMTIHSAKGLEFPNVFIAGMEEGIFPSLKNISEKDIEEERRLAYVAITRAKNCLYITNSSQRMIFGTTARNRVSRFIGEISPELTEKHSSISNIKVNSKSKSAVSKSAPLSLQQQISIYNKQAQNTVHSSAAPVEFQIGDRVNHPVFGNGVIIKAQKMAGDTLFEVEFEKAGKKKLMATFNKMVKI